MSATSADPVKLKAFVDGVKTARQSAETTQASVRSLSASHDRRLRGVRERAGARSARHAARQHGRERTLRPDHPRRAARRRQPRRRADHDLRRHARGRPVRQGRRHPAGAGVVRPGVGRGHPADVGLRRRPHLCRQRQHDPPGHRPGVPVGGGGAQHRAHVQLDRRRSGGPLRRRLVVGARRRAAA